MAAARRQWQSKGVQISFEFTNPGEGESECDGTLRTRDGVNMGPTFLVTREHLELGLSPEKQQFAVLTNGRSGGASYRLPVATEYWAFMKLPYT